MLEHLDYEEAKANAKIAMKFQNFMVGVKGVMYIAIGLGVVAVAAKICGL